MALAFWGASVIDKFGRRPMMLTSITGTLFVGFLPWTICNAVYVIDRVRGAGAAVIAFIFIFSAFYASTWNGILTGYTVECMSYDIRPKRIARKTCWYKRQLLASIISILSRWPILAENTTSSLTSSLLWRLSWSTLHTRRHRRSH
jgi:hypothetical protein